ncbi:type II toxin-antitoxin system Phd/YefM family antitoxin [Pseudanabaena sp. UWO311]|uniref:type II toxin-antitoxin system Phd/YefM family antitoxin n=1 Tax=Pseudanabaena sp. UWO311 TaxID=2487337 RepID=UPI001157BFC5|nr:type II toxin-antitoxin system Phd/YefM family antitoxin [Pseudanabaena sp. UWO311]TYQ24811.1 type II toxin-antitoxin system Phd/YefM family antitoxin [Pseudanabaena sp. UWO311]
MYQVTLNYAKANLDELCDRAGQEPEGVAIVRENRSYILITQEEWESLIETAELMQLPNLLNQVASARQEYQAGEALSMEQVFG